jgi:hypothetical protein
MKVPKNLPIYLFILLFLAIFVYLVVEPSIRKKKVEPINYDILADAADEIFDHPDVRRYISGDKKGKVLPGTAAVLLYYALNSGNKTMQQKAAIACGQAKDIYGTPYLIKLLKSFTPEVKESAEEALMQIWGLDLNVNEWQEFWKNKKVKTYLFSKIVGAFFIFILCFCLVRGILIKLVKPKQLWYVVPLTFIGFAWAYTIGFTKWLGTSVIYIDHSPIYYNSVRGIEELSSYNEYLIARFAQRAWIVIGIGLLTFGIWQGIRYIRKKWYGNKKH